MSNERLQGRSLLYEGWRRLKRNKLAMIGGSILVSFLLIAILAPAIAPQDPIQQRLYSRLTPPSTESLFGTDDFGRDILSRVIYGARISLRIGLVSVAIALIVGTAMGLAAGYWGGFVDNLIMRFVDVMLAFPSILLAIVIVAIIGPSLRRA